MATGASHTSIIPCLLRTESVGQNPSTVSVHRVLRGQLRRLANVRLPAGAMSASVKVFGCRPMMTAPRTPRAGVRKPPREETAGGRARWRVRCYGDFVAGGMYRRVVERDLRTRPRRVPGLIGRPRWAEPALSGDLLTKL